MYSGVIALVFVAAMILLIILGVFIPRLTKKIQYLRQEERKYTSLRNEREKELINLTAEFNTTKIQYDDIVKRISEGQSIVDNLINNGREIAEKQLQEEFAIKRQVLTQDLDKLRISTLADIEQQKIAAKETLIPLQEEVSNLTAKKEATIMALKREQERKNNVDFHRICLSQNDVKDIGYLKEVLNRLSNRNVIAKIIYETYLSTPVKELMMRIIGSDKKTGIYRISDINTQECYIGQAVNIKDRLTQHIKGSLGIQTIADQRIHHVMDERGVENWYFEILEECDKAQLNDREKYWINFYKSNELGFNKTLGGARSGI